MFERFTDRARRVVVLAQEEARRLNHRDIGTEHLLLGLAQPGSGPPAAALARAGAPPGPLRKQVAAVVGRGSHPPDGHIPFTPQAKRTLENALRETVDRGEGGIDSTHLLLGLLRSDPEGDSVALQVLDRLGVDREQLRQSVLELARDDDAVEDAQRAVEVPVQRMASASAAARAVPEPSAPGGPCCPTCRAPLADWARWGRLADVESTDADFGTRGDVSVLYCGHCDTTLGTLPPH